MAEEKIQAISIRLIGDNYAYWSKVMNNFLHGRGKWGYVAGETTEPDRPSGSGSSDESGCSSRKRARKEGLGGGLFDLNLPAEVIDRN